MAILVDQDQGDLPGHCRQERLDVNAAAKV